MAIFYADASALVKLVLDEPESPALRAFLVDADLVSCDLVLTEVPRAIRRAVSDGVALLPLDRAVLVAAGALSEPALRALDAIHLAAAVDVLPLDGFLTYDARQAAAARLAGLRTMAPGTQATA
jgi:uncharacterized protein